MPRRESSHDWKRSIRLDGKPLGFWLAENRFKLCDKDCHCHLCKDKIDNNKAKGKAKPKAKNKNKDKVSKDKKSLPGSGDTSSLSPGSSLSSSSSKMPPVSSKKRTSADRDSDSGVSSLSASYAKALLVDINSLSQEAAGRNKDAADNASQGSNNNRLLTEDETDYLTLIQEALAALNADSGGGGGGGGVPLIHVLLYVLHNHPHSDSLGPEEVSAVHLRVRHGLLFLSRMGVVDKFRLEGSAAGPSDSDTEDVESNDVVFKKNNGDDDAKAAKKSDTPSSSKAVNKDKKPLKAKQGQADLKKKKKQKKAGLKLGLKIKSKLSGEPQKSKIKKAAKGNKEGKTAEGKEAAPPKVVKNYRPLKLSPQLSQLCGGAEQLTRPEVLQKVWRYVKENQLQNPEQKTVIMADDTLRKVTKKKRVPQTMLMGMIDKHLKQMPS